MCTRGRVRSPIRKLLRPVFKVLRVHLENQHSEIINQLVQPDPVVCVPRTGIG